MRNVLSMEIPMLPAEIPHQIIHAGNLVALMARNTHIRQRGDGDENERDAHYLVNAGTSPPYGNGSAG